MGWCCGSISQFSLYLASQWVLGVCYIKYNTVLIMNRLLPCVILDMQSVWTSLELQWQLTHICQLHKSELGLRVWVWNIDWHPETHVRTNSQMLWFIDKWSCRTSQSPWSCCPMINVCLNPDFYLNSLFPAGKYLLGQILILSRWFHHFVKSTWIGKMTALTNQCVILRLLKSSTLILLIFWTLNVITNPILILSRFL